MTNDADTTRFVKQVPVVLPIDLLNKIDAYCDANGFSRSGFILRAVEKVIIGGVR